MWYVYVLVCKDGSLYTGISVDVEKRFVEHVDGRGGKYTRSHRPVKVVYREEKTSRSDALKRELEIKSWSRERKMNELKIESRE